MPARWHPWFAQWRLQSRRRGHARSLLRATLGLAAVIVPLAAWAGEGGRAALADAGLQTFARWPMAIALSLALLVHIAVSARLRPLAHELRNGWWAAAPLAPGSINRTLVAVGAVIALMATGVSVLLLAALAQAARTPVPFDVVGGVLLAGIGGGAVLGVATSLRRVPPPATERRRQPLLRLSALDDASLPHLFDWQHRAGVLRWRRGGHASVIAVAMLLLPGGATPGGGVGLLLLATVLAWLGAALAGAAEAATQAAALMRALPMVPQRRRRAVLRYPLFAFGCALAWSALAALLIGPVIELALLIAVLLLAVAARPALTLWRAGR